MPAQREARRENSLIISLQRLQGEKPRPRSKGKSVDEPVMIGGENDKHKLEPDRLEPLPLVDMIKNALRGKIPLFTTKAGVGFDRFVEYDELVESIDKAIPVPGKSVILLVTKPLNGSGEPETVGR